MPTQTNQPDLTTVQDLLAHTVCRVKAFALLFPRVLENGVSAEAGDGMFYFYHDIVERLQAVERLFDALAAQSEGGDRVCAPQKAS